ncbi:hypothetical protein [Microcoleus sp. D2_18a_D3]
MQLCPSPSANHLIYTQTLQIEGSFTLGVNISESKTAEHPVQPAC